jgi:DNA replication protein DnaC
METIDDAIGIWKQLAPIRFKEALEQKPNPCPMCRGEADLINLPIPGDGSVTVPCVCQTALYARRMWDDCLKANRISTSDRQRTLRQLNEYGTKAQWATMFAAMKSLRSLIDNPLQHKWITMIGDKGCGKSHVVLSARNLLDRYAVYFYCSTLGDEIFNSLDHDSTVQLKRRLIHAPVLMLDDLGTEPAKSDFVAQFINSVIGERYQLGIYAPTVITTNLSIKDLDDRYDRMADRILDERLVIQHSITLPSYRRPGKKVG